MIAFTPRCVALEWASSPVTSVVNRYPLLWAFTTRMLVGSPTITTRGLGNSATIFSTSGRTPRQPTSSSYEKAKCTGVPSGRETNSGTSASAMAMNPFMSHVPRPKSLPSRSTMANGSLVHG